MTTRKQIKPTWHDLQAVARPLGVSIEVDTDCGCYRACAPSGQVMDDLHEFVAPYENVPGSADKYWRAEARQDLIERLTGVHIEDCPDYPDCEWCSNAAQVHA